eukprot:65237-Rhodomonas_salina.1
MAPRHSTRRTTAFCTSFSVALLPGPSSSSSSIASPPGAGAWKSLRWTWRRSGGGGVGGREEGR